MSENNDRFPKLENMIDKLIETDEELEKNGENNELKFDSEDEKFFEKDFFINPSFKNEGNNKIDISNFSLKNNYQPYAQQNKINPFTINNISNLNNMNKNVYNNIPTSYYYNNFIPPQQINNNFCNSSNLRNPSNSNLNTNSTTSFSSNYDNNINNQNFNTSYIFFHIIIIISKKIIV